MNDIIVTMPLYLAAELQEIADKVGVSLDELAAYFFTRGAVHA